MLNGIQQSKTDLGRFMLYFFSFFFLVKRENKKKETRKIDGSHRLKPAEKKMGCKRPRTDRTIFFFYLAVVKSNALVA